MTPARAFTFAEARQSERTDSSGEKPDIGNILSYVNARFKRRYADFCALDPQRKLDFSSPDDPVSRNVFLSTEPAAVQIKAIPEEDALESYLESTANYPRSGALPYTASVGDVINLLEYGGYGSFTLARPEISELEGIKDVCVYPAPERSTDSGVAFDYKLRPPNKGIIRFRKSKLPTLMLNRVI